MLIKLSPDTSMSNYRNHREPRRRGFDDDSTQEPGPSYFQREPSRAAAPVGSPSVDVEVLWFNVDKGFGFVKLADDSKAFLHVSALENAGHRVVSEGMHLTVRIGEGQKGPQVAEVLAVRAGSSSAGIKPASAPHPGPASSTPGEQKPGVVKRYKAAGYGFVCVGVLLLSVLLILGSALPGGVQSEVMLEALVGAIIGALVFVLGAFVRNALLTKSTRSLPRYERS